MTSSDQRSGEAAVVVEADSHHYRVVVPDSGTDYIQGLLARTGAPYEHEMLRDMASRLSPGDLVLDVGANIGNHTLYLAAVARAAVVAYEPNERLTEPLLASIQLNGLADRVAVRAVAVGDHAGRGSFAEEMPTNLGGQSVQDDEEGVFELVRLDDERLPAVPAMVKIDVEGMELPVLAGAARLIAEHRPVIYVECRDRGEFAQVDRWARAHGYVVCDEFNSTPTFRLEPSEKLSEVDRLDRAIARALRERFEVGEQLKEARARLDDVNLRYRSLSAAQQAVRAELSDVHRQLATSHEAHRDAEESLAEARTTSDHLRASVARLRAEHSEAAATAQRELAEHRRALQAARDERAALAAEVDRVSSAASEAVDAAERRLTQEIRAAAVRERDIARARDAAEREAAEARSQAQSAADELVRLREALARHQRERAAQRRVSEEAELRSRLLRDERDRLASELAASRADTEVQRGRVRELRGSLTFRTGREVRRASSSIGAALKLPVTLVRLARQPRVATGRVLEAAPRPRDEQEAVVTPPGRPAGEIAPAPQRRAPRARTHGERLRVAAIMDEFTRLCFAPEWDLTDLTPQGWERELTASDPDMLFVESAWRGRDGAWHNMVDRAGEELRAIIEWCRARGVPTVFWNKEDPVHYATFLNAAGLFDHVFTTDLDRIEHYKAALGHENVWLLPFAAQPALHHPLIDGDRRDAFMFAGAYYRRYPERTRDLESFMEHLPALRPVEIYDRNHGGTDEAYMFPESYQASIVGTLAPGEVADAYRHYRFAINLNSVKQSQTMLARRIFELLASGTVTVSNFSRAARVFFGDLVVTTDSGAEAVRRLGEIVDGGREDQTRLAALRAVMSQHTYADRAAYVWAKAAHQSWRPWAEQVDVVALADTDDELRRVTAALLRQEHQAWSATVLVGDGVTAGTSADRRIAVVPLSEAPATVAQLGTGSALLAAMWSGDYYGPHYLLDLALGSRYTAAEAIGKNRYFRREQGVTSLGDGVEYGVGARVGVRRSLMRRSGLTDVTTEALIGMLRTDATLQVGTQVSLDRFGYCAGATDAPEVDDVLPSAGASMAELLTLAESVGPSAGTEIAGETLGAGELAQVFAGATRKGIDLEPGTSGLRVSAHLDENAHDYVYAREGTPVSAEWLESGRVYVETERGLDLQIALVFQDAEGERLGSTVVRSNTNAVVEPPSSTGRVKLGIRVRGRGTAVLRSISWGHRLTEPAEILPRARTLVVTNIYPSYDDLYRNGFVHSRVRSYRANGIESEIFCLARGANLTYREFEGVDVTTGGPGALEATLRRQDHREVLVHFLDPDMWGALQERRHGTRVVIWIHGSEVQPWWRRSYNITDDAQLDLEKEKSERRLRFWREVFTSAEDDVHFVFVSRYFADEVMEDVGVELRPDQFSIVHNPIDTDLFVYQPKHPDLRRRVLSIRPYASRKYANDLAVSAVLAMRDEPEFPEMTFRFVGDGALFDETLEPIRDLPNVIVERRFLSQREIVELHREHGVFLVPTRMDAQGVSRDEAMASGLVPVTNAVAAIPEFVDDESGVLAPGEDPVAMAAGMLMLVRDPERFGEMSSAAAARVVRQSAAHAVVRREIEIIRGDMGQKP